MNLRASVFHPTLQRFTRPAVIHFSSDRLADYLVKLDSNNAGTQGTKRSLLHEKKRIHNFCNGWRSPLTEKNHCN
ncbi:Hypothetical predicted protein [Podarcis lilfordi]|uniref:Uncharacterized protein n=1 Tax=Podarcis lilfordi TaxID=74358 RepID=A0AA35KIN6_9SAUR|nr:Hypothetical predicted protein [Podarcis lilfordi]